MVYDIVHARPAAPRTAPIPAPAVHPPTRRQLLHHRPGRQPRAAVRRRLAARRAPRRDHLPRATRRVAIYNPTCRTAARFYRDTVAEDVSRVPERVRVRHLHQEPPDPEPRASASTTRRRRTTPSAIAGNPLIPNLLPALDFAGGGHGHRLERRLAAPRASPTRSTSRARRWPAPPSRATRASSDRRRRAGTTRSAARPTSSTTGTTPTATRRSRSARSDLAEASRDFAGVNPNNPGALGGVRQRDRSRTIKNDKDKRGRGRHRARAGRRTSR